MNLKNEKVGILDMVESKANETTLLKSINGYNRQYLKIKAWLVQEEIENLVEL